MIRNPIRSPLSSAIRSVFEPSRGGGVAPLVFPLDEAGALPPAAYGNARLTSAYSGPAIRIRNSGGDEIDVGFAGQFIDRAAVDSHFGGASGTVVTWYDLTGNGNHATQPDVASQGATHADLLLAGGVTSKLGVGYILPAGVSLDRRNAEVCAVVSFINTATQSALYEIGAVDSAHMRLFQLSTNGGRLRGQPPGTNSPFKPQVRPVWLDHIASSTGSSLEQDGEITSGGALTTLVSSGGYFGRIITAGYTGSLFLGFTAFYDRVLSVGERSALKSASDSLFNCLSTGGALIIQGDSIAASSSAATVNNGWLHQLIPGLNNSPKVFNYAGGGMELQNQLPLFSTKEALVLAAYPAQRRVVVVASGTNDMCVAARTSAQLYADVQTYCGYVRAAGGLVIVASLLPRTGYGTSSSAEFATYNGLLRSNWATFADGFIDFAADPVMGAFGAYDDTALYLDGLHPTMHGNSFLAATALPEINRVFALP